MTVAARVLFILAGSALAGFLGYHLVGIAGRWAEAAYARNDSDLGTIFMAGLCAWTVLVLAGGLAGNWLYVRRRQARAQQHD